MLIPGVGKKWIGSTFINSMPVWSCCFRRRAYCRLSTSASGVRNCPSDKPYSPKTTSSLQLYLRVTSMISTPLSRASFNAGPTAHLSSTRITTPITMKGASHISAATMAMQAIDTVMSLFSIACPSNEWWGGSTRSLPPLLRFRCSLVQFSPHFSPLQKLATPPRLSDHHLD